MQLQKFRLYRRRNGTFYWQGNESSRQGSLRTKNESEADRLLHAKNEAHREPVLNLAMGRAYLAAHDPEMVRRPWQRVISGFSFDTRSVSHNSSDSVRISGGSVSRAKLQNRVWFSATKRCRQSVQANLRQRPTASSFR